MAEQIESRVGLGRMPFWMVAAVLFLIAAALIWPGDFAQTALFVAWSLVVIAPFVIPGILLAAWIIASGADSRIARVFEGRMGWSILAAAAIGAVTPVCGVTVLPLMAGLLAGGVPLAPVMAFWLSSPVTDPAMLATTAATLGVAFAVGKTVAAFMLGLLGGAGTLTVSRAGWAHDPLRNNAMVGRIVAARCGGDMPFLMAVWADADRRRVFARQLWATTRLILICLIPAFAAEHVLNALLQPEALSAYVGQGTAWAIPLAVFVGAPAYVDGYAALPLTRALIDHGMSQGAAMAFLVSGGVVSIWGAMAIFPVLKLRPFLLYLLLAVTGSLLAGYGFEAAMSF
ncbi:permease [uncultured Roseovarius sp.]|uniref:permease n=1 Tax=uncultured Roseovarius sp. TaxID=293344 RepID=UPI0026371537|nr:permease [uncultured Roseovarius sp.]